MGSLFIPNLTVPRVQLFRSIGQSSNNSGEQCITDHPTSEEALSGRDSACGMWSVLTVVFVNCGVSVIDKMVHQLIQAVAF